MSNELNSSAYRSDMGRAFVFLLWWALAGLVTYALAEVLAFTRYPAWQAQVMAYIAGSALWYLCCISTVGKAATFIGVSLALACLTAAIVAGLTALGMEPWLSFAFVSILSGAVNFRCLTYWMKP